MGLAVVGERDVAGDVLRAPEARRSVARYLVAVGCLRGGSGPSSWISISDGPWGASTADGTNLGGVQAPAEPPEGVARGGVHEQGVLGALCFLEEGLVCAEIALEDVTHYVRVCVDV